MRMPDVNVLVNAHRVEDPQHERYARWVTELATGLEPFALSESVLHGFVSVVTNPRVFNPPSTMADAFEFLDSLLSHPRCHLMRPGPRHWSIFRSLCETKKIHGNLVSNAGHSALAIESGCEWVTADTDYARFAPPLRWTLL